MQSVPYYEKPPTYEHFLEHHLKPNLPALIGPELTAHWRARQEWVEPIDSDPEGPSYKPRFEFLREAFGEATAQVADCSERHFTDQKRSDMKFSDFVDVWQEGRYYLKDWHFCRAFPEYEAYTVPDIFADDWMNEFWLQGNKDDYRFVYMGGNGTFTPFHADVFRSYSWSSNICGIKKWTLFYPGQEHLLCDSLGNFPYDIRDIDTKQFPNFSKAKRIVLYQKDGETLFVPSGWFHQVENVGPTISINHNWSNACNLSFTYRSLQADLKSVEHSIEDLRNEMPHEEFVDTCQRLLLVHSGWDWTIFCQLLVCIARRLAEQTEAKLQPDPAWQVQRIQEVVADMKNCIDIEYYFKRHPDVCLQDIEQWLSHRRCCSSP